MKKILIFAASAALLLTACAKVETNTTTAADENVPIAFGAYAGRNITKATSDSYVPKGATTFTATNQQIGVYAYKGDAAAADFMVNVPVTLASNGSTASADYDPVKYWPKVEIADNALSFIAYYPYGGAGIDVTAFGTGTSRYGAIGFTVQDAVANQVDLMVAAPVENQYYSTNTTNPGTVPFVFRHTLTRVLFQMKTDVDANTEIKVTSLKMTSIKNEGTYTVGATDASWESVTGTKEYVIPFPTAALTATAAPEDVAANVFLLMPQDIDNAAKLQIEYTVKDKSGITMANTAEVQLNTITDGNSPIATWAPNQNVIYTITISLKPIKFTATVTDWAAATAGAWNIE